MGGIPPWQGVHFFAVRFILFMMLSPGLIAMSVTHSLCRFLHGNMTINNAEGLAIAMPLQNLN